MEKIPQNDLAAVCDGIHQGEVGGDWMVNLKIDKLIYDRIFNTYK